jgi:hypothetical protein
MKYLKQLIEEVLLSEKAVAAAAADAQNLALSIITYDSFSKAYTLFDRNKFISVLIDEIRKMAKAYGNITVKKYLEKLSVGNKSSSYTFTDRVADRFSEFVVAGTSVDKSKSSQQGWANGAWEMHGPVATQGYGPLLYDIVMADLGELMPDREGVSPSARKIWKYYKNNREDIESTPLDDVNNPITSQQSDDADVFFKQKKDFGNYLDSSYHMKTNGPDVNNLRKAYTNMLNNIKKTTGIDQKIIEVILQGATDRYYYKRIS